MFFVYMIKNSTNQLYVGVTDDPEQRLDEHNSKRGASFTKYTSTYRVVFLEKYSTMAGARKREIQIKKWRRDKKEFLIFKYQHGLETKA